MNFNDTKRNNSRAALSASLWDTFNCSRPQAYTLWPHYKGSAMFWLPQQTSWCIHSIEWCLSIRKSTQLCVCLVWACWAPGSLLLNENSCDKRTALPDLSLLFWVKELSFHVTNVGAYFKPYRQRVWLYFSHKVSQLQRKAEEFDAVKI